MSYSDMLADVFQLYYPVSTYDGRSPFQLLLASEFANKKNELFKRTRHLYYTFSYVVSGKGKLTVAGRDYYPKSKDMFILPKYSAHTGVTDPADPWHKIYFEIDGWLIGELLRAYLLDDCHFVRNCDQETCFRQMLLLAKNHHSDVHDKAVILFHELLINIRKKDSYLLEYSSPVKKALTFIKEHLEEEISMQDIADNIGLSPEHLTRLFKKEIGTTPYQFYLKKRINLAQVLLTNTAMTIKEVAYRLGYKDEFYFSNCFKKYTGISPLNYRKSNNFGSH